MTRRTELLDEGVDALSPIHIFPPHSRMTPMILGWGMADLTCKHAR